MVLYCKALSAYLAFRSGQCGEQSSSEAQFVLRTYYNVLPVLGHCCQNHQLKANDAKLGGAVCSGGEMVIREMGNYQLYEV